MSNAEPSRRITVFALGGTIAMTDSGDGTVTPTLSADQLIAAIPGLSATDIAIDTIDFRKKPGACLTPADIAALTSEIATRQHDLDGAVVTQGTDTIEETAYLLDLLHHLQLPVVVTGAMRNPMLAGADGPANLLAAILTAADPSMQGQGCLVVFNDEIHAAHRVRKTHTTSTASFASPDGGPLGYLTENRPQLLNRRIYRPTLPTMAPETPAAHIPIVTVTLGDGGTSLRALAPHVDGLIVAGFGAGHVPADLIDTLTKLAATVPVVLASRTGAGTVLATTYGFPGAEQDLLARGLIRAGYLDPLKARILLHTLLGGTADRTVIADAFAVAGGYAHPDSWPWPDHLYKDC